MKKVILTTMLAAVLVVAGFNQQAVHAADPNVIEGTVIKEGTPVSGAEVKIEYATGSTTVQSDSAGHYSAPITSPPPVGSNVTITAKKGDYVKRIVIVFKLGRIIIIIIIIKTIPVPEYGPVGAIAAAGVGLGALLYIRRRNEAQMF